MKVCLINHLYKPFVGSGAENVVETIADGFVKSGAEVTVITTKPKFWQKPIPSLPYRVIYLGSFLYNLDKIPYAARFLWHVFNVFDIFTALKVKSLLKEEKSDLVITNNLAGLSYLIPVVISQLKFKHIHILHDIQLLHPSGLLFYGQEKKINSFTAEIYQFFLKKMFAQVDTVFSPSQWLLDMHYKKGFFNRSEKKVIANPVVAGAKCNEERDDNFFRILYATQIESHKGIFFLVETFKKLSEANTDKRIKLVIIGGGSEQNHLQNLIKDCRNIEYMGRVDRVRVYKEMSKSDLLVVPSLCCENSPTVIFEAISCGLPVVAANMGGIGEILNKYGGILFNPVDASDLNEKLNSAIKNPQQLEEIRNSYLRYHNELSNSTDDYITNLTL